MLAVQSNGISCGFRESKSAIILVRHHPLPRSRNERRAVAVLTDLDNVFVGICRQLSRRICRLLAPFTCGNLSPCIGVWLIRSKGYPIDLETQFRLIPPPLRLSPPPPITSQAHL